MRRGLSVLVVCAGLMLGGGVAYAEGDPAPSPSVQSRNVTPLQRNITPLQRNITPMDTRTTSGKTTVITLQSDVLFDFGSAQLSEQAKKKIGQVVSDAPKGVTLSVDGYTDNIPYERGNDVLSKERAQAVADAITAARPDLKTKVTGHGEKDPVAPNTEGGKDNPEGRAKNRRVEIRYGG